MKRSKRIPQNSIKSLPQGEGFGKKKKPKEDKESGYSSSYARLAGVLTEGPAEGPIGGKKGVYFDETVWQNDDNTENFQGLAFDFRPGTGEQSGIPGYTDDATSEVAVGPEVKYNLPITRTINNANLDILRVRLGFQLQEYPPTGGYRTLKIEFRILIKEGSGGFVERHRETLKARWSSPVELSYEFPINNVGGTVNTYLVRVERLTPQDTDTNRYQRVMTWKAYAEVVATRLNYAYSTLAALQFEAKQFDSLPQVAFKIGGRLILIPTNATVGTDRGLDYSGTWDGNFIQAPIAVADPAWIFYDLVTNRRYGLGKYIDASKISKWKLYSLSKYCNEMISDGMGGFERRYLCHCYLQGKEDAWRVLDALRSVFRGFLYWMEGALHIVADRPEPTTVIVTQADVEGGIMAYSRTPLRSRHTIARVTWLDPNNFYKQTIESVVDEIGIERYGQRELEMSAFGCTSQSQAHRAGWAALISERLELETVRVRVRPYVAGVSPGKVMKAMDIKRSIVRFGGLVAGSTLDTITLDHPVTIISGETYTLTLMLPDGSLAEQSVYTTAGYHSVLQFASLTSTQEPPEIESPWILSSTTVMPGKYRILGIVPVSGENGLLYEVSGLQYEEEKYDKIDTDYFIPSIPPAPKPPALVPPPLNVKAIAQRSSINVLVSATWERPVSDYITGYIAEYKTSGGDWGNRVELGFPSASWDAIADAPYTVRVACVDLFGNVSVWVEAIAALGYINLDYNYSTGHSMINMMLL